MPPGLRVDMWLGIQRSNGRANLMVIRDQVFRFVEALEGMQVANASAVTSARSIDGCASLVFSMSSHESATFWSGAASFAGG